MKKIAAAYIRVSTHMQESCLLMHSLDVLETGEMCMVIIYQTNMFLSIMEFLEEKQKKRHDFLRMIGLAKTKPASTF